MKATKTLFKKYLQTESQKEKHLIEKRFLEDDFVMDAFEGFESTENSWVKFQRFDRKMRRSERRTRWGLASALVLSLVIGAAFLPKTDTNARKTTSVTNPKPTQIKIHKQKDISIMPRVAIQEQFTPQQVVEDLNAKMETAETKAEIWNELQRIPTRQVELNKQKSKGLTLKVARELIVQNFRVVDYRYYRNDDEQFKQGFTENEQGEQHLKIPYINILNKAIGDFSKEEYKLALLNFDVILENYPDDANALFYGAMCLYNLGQFQQAEGRFLKLQNIPFANFSEEGHWYLLHVYKAAKKEAAFSSLRLDIIEQEGFYAQKASQLTFN